MNARSDGLQHIQQLCELLGIGQHGGIQAVGLGEEPQHALLLAPAVNTEEKGAIRINSRIIDGIESCVGCGRWFDAHVQQAAASIFHDGLGGLLLRGYCRYATHTHECVANVFECDRATAVGANTRNNLKILF